MVFLYLECLDGIYWEIQHERSWREEDCWAIFWSSFTPETSFPLLIRDYLDCYMFCKYLDAFE